MSTSSGPFAAFGSRPILVAALGLALGLTAVVALDFAATRRELLGLLRVHATSLRESVAAAARANRAAARVAEQQLGARLLESARLLAELDRAGQLDDERLETAVARHGLFRANVFDSDGRLERSSAGPGRSRLPRGPGSGQSAMLGGLLSGEQTEVTGTIHASRGWGGGGDHGAGAGAGAGGGARLVAGVRRARGGAILLNADASSVDALLKQTSLEVLLAEVADHAPDVAYVELSGEGLRLARGEVPEALDADPSADSEALRETAAGTVLELAGPLALEGDASARLRLGMRLDGVRRAESRMLLQLGLSLGASLALAGLGVGGAWLRRKYSLLSAEHARAEEALRRRDRLAAMGELAATVAHELRNPLNAIGMSAQRLRREFLEPAGRDGSPEQQAELAELLDVVTSETGRIDSRIRGFLDYARPPRLDPRPTDLSALVRELGAARRPFAETRGVSLETAAAGTLSARVDPDRLREALDNLVRNAIEATPAGGRVVLAVAAAPDGAAIEVRDTGAGIPKDLLPRVFDLYFTTKADGTGVGLAVAQQIVVAHGGTLEVDSEPGRGTRMTLRLPAAGPPAEVGT